MAKHHIQKKHSNVISTKGQGVSFEQQESIDDSLLPDAEELAKLKELDPNVIDWVKERTAKEQDARLDFNHRKMTLIERSQKMAYRVDLLAIVFAFLIVMASMAFSYYLIQANQVIYGSIFAGVTVLFAANSFLNFRKKPQGQDAKKQ